MTTAQTIDEVIKLDRFSTQIGERLKTNNIKFREGVKVRLVTCVQPRNVPIAVKKNKMEVRYVPFETPVDIAIYNGNRAHLAIFSNRENILQTEVGALTSNHPCFVQMLQNYFDVLWKSAKTENEVITKQKRPLKLITKKEPIVQKE